MAFVRLKSTISTDFIVNVKEIKSVSDVTKSDTNQICIALSDDTVFLVFISLDEFYNILSDIVNCKYERVHDFRHVCYVP